MLHPSSSIGSLFHYPTRLNPPRLVTSSPYLYSLHISYKTNTFITIKKKRGQHFFLSQSNHFLKKHTKQFFSLTITNKTQKIPFLQPPQTISQKNSKIYFLNPILLPNTNTTNTSQNTQKMGRFQPFCFRGRGLCFEIPTVKI